MDKKPTYKELERKVREFDLIESEYKKTLTALQKRVKELNCLYDISHFVESEKNLHEILQETVNLIPGSWQYPEIATCRIILNENLFRSNTNCQKTCDKCSHVFMKQPILVNGTPSGEVRICYLEEKPEADEGPFLREERNLLNAVAERLGRIVERKQSQEALRESERRLISAQHISKLGDFTLDVGTGHVTWSDALFEVLKYDRSEKFDFDRIKAEIYHPDDLKGIRQWLSDCIASGGDVLTPHEHRLIRKDGEIINVRVVGVVDQKQEESAKVFGTVLDITEYKRAEEALLNSKNLLNDMGSIAKIGGWEDDLVTGQAVWTKEVYNIVEIESKPVMGLGEHLKHCPEESRKLFDEAYRRAIETGEPFDLTLQCNTAKGRQIWVRVIGRPEFKDGKCVKMKGTFQDITEQKRVENALQESEEKYRTLVENANNAIFITQDEMIKFPNPKTTEMFGYSEDELSDVPFINLIHPEDREMVMGRYLNGEPSPSGYSFRIINKAGDELWVQPNAARITWEDRPATINIIRDITEQRRLENQLRQSQKMESIGTLAGGIAHDFNNILGIILGNTELALDDVPEWNPARLNLEEVRIASLRAKDVIRQLLSFARKTMVEKKPTNLSSIIKESLKLLRASIPTSINIRQNIPGDIDAILADPTQINQVLINLCTNADHAMPHGGTLEVSLENIALHGNRSAQYPAPHPGRYVHLSVRDTGHGISQEDMDNIFDPYFTTKEVGKGTGMGLAVVHGIVEEHNGIITVKSTPGKGTTFDLFFPSIEKEAVIETEKKEELPTGDERILLIDDEESIVQIGQQRLKRLGYQVKTATSPLDALAMFQSKPQDYDLIISDMTMPDMTGDRLVKEILNIRPGFPIILCTGFSKEIDEVKAAAIGAADYIEKPLDKYEFALKVRKVLDETKTKLEDK